MQIVKLKSNPPQPPFFKRGGARVSPFFKGGRVFVSPLCKGGLGGIFFTVFVLFALSFALSCAHQKKIPLTHAVHKESEDEKASAETYWRYIKSEIFAVDGNFGKAREELSFVMGVDPGVGYLYYEQANDEADQNHINEAIDSCKKAIDLSPDLVQARILLARLYSAKADHDGSIKLLSDTIRNHPYVSESYVLLAREQINLKRYNEAVTTLNKLLLVEPESNVAYYYLGLTYGSYLRRYDKAIAAYNKILESDSENIQVQSEIAQIYLERRQPKKALDMLLAMEGASPNDVSVQLKIALVYYEIRDFDHAVERFEKILVANPESDKIRFYLGVIYSEMGNVDAAVSHFKLVPANSGYFKDANLQVAKYYYSLGDFDECVKIIETAALRRPEVSEFYLFLAAMYEYRGQFDKEVEILKLGVHALPQDEQMLFALGVAYDKARDQKEALQVMKKVLVLNPKNASALNYVGYIYADRGENLDEAETMLQDAAQIRPDDGYIIDSLGWLYFKKGDLTKAYELLKQATRLSPKEPTVFEHMGDLHKARVDMKQALVAYKKALKFAKEKKAQDPKEVERLEKKICEAGGCN